MTTLIQRLRLFAEMWWPNEYGLCHEAADEIERLTAERDAALADAERFRWLANDSDGDLQDNIIRWLAHHVVSRNEVDAAIDAARGEKT
jgi:hypothetical protein